MALSKVNPNFLNVSQVGGRRNLIMNGEFVVAQRGTSFTNIGSAGTYDDTFTMDRFLISQGVGSGRCSVEQSSDTPDGFSKSLKISTTTADTSIAAAEYHRLQTKFEGQDLQRFAKGTSGAKQYTLSFYCKANANATYVVELNDVDNARSVSKTFSVTTNWTRVIVTFPADTTGAFDNDNNLSMELNWWMHTGSTYGGGTLQTTWASQVQANRAVGIDSIFDSTSRTFFITGVQLEVGDTASPFEHRSFGEELQSCYRYYRVVGPYGNPYQTNGLGYYLSHAGSGMQNNENRVAIPYFETPFRSAPAITHVNYANGGTGALTEFSSGTVRSQTGAWDLSIHGGGYAQFNGNFANPIRYRAIFNAEL